MSPRRAKVLIGTDSTPGALRRHLIAVTQRLLAAHGLTGLTTRQIAREAQVADGILYNYFADKDDLVLTAMDEQAKRAVVAFLAVCPEPGTATLKENLTSLARAATTLNTETLPLVTGLFGQAPLVHGFLTRIYSDELGPQKALAATADYVRAEQQLGRAGADVDPTAIAELLFGVCQLRALVAQMGPDDTSVQAADIDVIVDTLLRALRPATT
jgi:AcrR family transcriptional regulator